MTAHVRRWSTACLVIVLMASLAGCARTERAPMVSVAEAQREARAALATTLRHVRVEWKPTREIVPSRCVTGKRNEAEGVWFSISARVVDPVDRADLGRRLVDYWTDQGLDVEPYETDFGGEDGMMYVATARASGVPWQGYEMGKAGSLVSVQTRCADGDIHDFDE